jgi:uncharacterized protein involved in response to NO
VLAAGIALPAGGSALARFVMLMITIVAGRIVPLFTRNALLSARVNVVIELQGVARASLIPPRR